MATVELLQVFLASPSDVTEERNSARSVIDAINQTVGREKNVRLEIIGWETDSYPEYGRDAQAVINQQIPAMAHMDLFVGIMWNRFGSPTPRAGSGTEEEFRRAVDSLKKNGKPHIMFYFNQLPYNPSSAPDAEQKLKVLTFKDEIKKDGLTFDYSGAEDFRDKFRTHIEKWLIQHSAAELTTPHLDPSAEHSFSYTEKEGANAALETVSDSGMWLLLKSQFSEASEVHESDNRKLTVKIPITNASEDAFFRSLQDSQSRRELLPFAHQNTGALANVVEVDRISTGPTAVWTVVLQLDQEYAGFGSDMAYGNTTGDEIATMRARYILLNEEPRRPGAVQSDGLEDAFFNAFVEGISTRVKVQGSVLPALWRELKGNRDTFLRVARLWSVFHLITSNTCQYILELTLGPIRDGSMRVRFRGQRRKEYANRDPYIIEIEGECPLQIDPE